MRRRTPAETAKRSARRCGWWIGSKRSVCSEDKTSAKVRFQLRERRRRRPTPRHLTPSDLWGDTSEKRVLTGADTLGRLLRGIATRGPVTAPQ
jgi:hypothetical protein